METYKINLTEGVCGSDGTVMGEEGHRSNRKIILYDDSTYTMYYQEG